MAFQQHGMQFGHILVTGRVPFSSLWACLLANARPVRHFKKSTKYYALLAFTNRQIVLPISKLPRAQKSQRRFNIRFKLSYVYALLRLPNMECVFSSKKLGLELEMIRKVLFLHALVVRKPLHLKKTWNAFFIDKIRYYNERNFFAPWVFYSALEFQLKKPDFVAKGSDWAVK